MCPVRIQPATATTTKAGETCVSIVRRLNAHTGARCESFLLPLYHAYTILGMEKIEAETRWTAARAAVDPPRALPTVSGPRRACGIRLVGVALRCAYPTSRRRRGTPSGSVTRFTPLPAVGLMAPTRTRRDARLSRNDSHRHRAFLWCRNPRALFSLQNRSLRSLRSKRLAALGKSRDAVGPIFEDGPRKPVHAWHKIGPAQR
jgi:hypothetical protein